MHASSPFFWIITRRREELGLSVPQAAANLGLAAHELQELELGYSNQVSGDVLKKIEKLYDVTARELGHAGLLTSTRSQTSKHRSRQ